MARCSNCQFENVADAKACARCGEKLTSSDKSVPERETASTLPDWMRSVQAGGRPIEAGVALTSSGGVAAAATLPVQVRRSRVPVLSVNGPAQAAAVGAAVAGISAAGELPATDGDVPIAQHPGNRLRIVLLVAIILAIAIVILARFAIHGSA